MLSWSWLAFSNIHHHLHLPITVPTRFRAISHHVIHNSLHGIVYNVLLWTVHCETVFHLLLDSLIDDLFLIDSQVSIASYVPATVNTPGGNSEG